MSSASTPSLTYFSSDLATCSGVPTSAVELPAAPVMAATRVHNRSSWTSASAAAASSLAEPLDVLSRRYGRLDFNAIDNIMAPEYTEQLFGRLAEAKSDIRLHYEIRPHFKREQLASANVKVAPRPRQDRYYPVLRPLHNVPKKGQWRDRTDHLPQFRR